MIGVYFPPCSTSDFIIMEISKLIGCLEYSVDLYDIKLLVKDDKKLDIYVRHNTRMSIFEAKGYELTKISSKVHHVADCRLWR